jgi:hypothetical protein
VFALDEYAGRIVVLYRESDQADPWLHGWVDPRRCKNVVVNLKRGRFDVALEASAIKPRLLLAPVIPLRFFGIHHLAAIAR